MASKLDQSLDAIIGDRGTARRGRGARRTRAGRPAPVGGVKKATAAVGRAATKVAAKVTGKTGNKSESTPASAGATKVLVSNLPTDVSEVQIKDYFQQVAGPVRRVWLTYGANGQSRGIATILFANAAAGAKAMDQKGTKVDNRTLRVEAVMHATDSSAPPARTLRERATVPNAQPKKATAAPATQPARNGTRAGARGGRGRTARGRNAGRPKKKTAEELDAEMTDYFGGNAGEAGAPTAHAAPAAPAAATAQAGGDDMGMDEIS